MVVAEAMIHLISHSLATSMTLITFRGSSVGSSVSLLVLMS